MQSHLRLFWHMSQVDAVSSLRKVQTGHSIWEELKSSIMGSSTQAEGLIKSGRARSSFSLIAP